MPFTAPVQADHIFILLPQAKVLNRLTCGHHIYKNFLFLQAHKAVMAACSDYFLTAICGGKSTASVSVSDGPSGSHMTIELQYVTMRGFAPLLEYAYTSDLTVNSSDVIDVLAAASYMQMFDVS